MPLGLQPTVPPLLALPTPPLITLFRKSDNVRKFADWEWIDGATRLDALGVDSKLFRNGAGNHPDSSENQVAYFQNAPGFKRYGCGTICGKSKSGETVRAANRLSLTKNMP